MWFAGLYFALDQLGIELFGILASLAVFSLIIGLAVQQTLGNIVNSFLLLSTDPLRLATESKSKEHGALSFPLAFSQRRCSTEMSVLLSFRTTRLSSPKSSTMRVVVAMVLLVVSRSSSILVLITEKTSTTSSTHCSNLQRSVHTLSTSQNHEFCFTSSQTLQNLPCLHMGRRLQ